ncbi:RluA family pseudouridine synthase [Candidatus Peregrinibacteria bacterium]|nr:RluA family pseudouridine synthase [Candidatus Peregrinibacteria bacterium]
MSKKESIPIIYEDENLLAVNKPARVVSVPDPNTPLERSVLGMVKEQCAERGFNPFLLHRLDVQTSGVLLFGKTPKLRSELEEILVAPTTRKKYVALLKGIPRGNKIENPLKSRESGELVPAKTDFRVLRHFDLFGIPCSIVEAEIHGGRRHQIRQHFAQIGCPVAMDAQYGDIKFNKKFRIGFHFSRLFLHSKSLQFVHPVTQKTTLIEAPFPPDMMSVSKKVFGRGNMIF